LKTAADFADNADLTEANETKEQQNHGKNQVKKETRISRISANFLTTDEAKMDTDEANGKPPI